MRQTGYEHHEIARLLRCSVGNSKSQLHKATVRMRELLGRQKAQDGTQATNQRRLELQELAAGEPDSCRRFDQSWESASEAAA